jgi:O-antigen/teichoic acid export membrane protein/O-antigen ligase
MLSDRDTSKEPRIVRHIANRLQRLSADRRSLGGSLATTGFLQLVLIASGVVVARSLGAEDRGYLALLIAIYGICTFVGSLGIFSALPYFMARDPDASRRIVRSLRRLAVLQVVGTVAVQAVVLVAIAADDPPRVQVAALISLLVPPAIFAYGYAEAILLGQQRFTAFNVFRAVTTTTYAAFVLVAFVLGVADIIVVMTIWTGASLLGGFLALAVAVRGLPKTAHDGPIPSRRTITVFGLKSLLGSLSPIESFRADQAVVGLLLSPVALGLYVVAQAFTNLPRAASQSIGYIAYPRVAACPDRTEGRRALWKYFFVGVVVTGAVVAFLVVTADKLVAFFFGAEFAGAVPVARILLVGVFFSAIRRVLTDGLRGLGHPGIGTIAEASSWIFLVPAFAVLLPHGATGVALALTIGWALSLGVALGFAVMEGKVLFQVPLTVLRSRSVALVVGSAGVVVAAGAAAASFSLSGALALLLVIAGVLFFAFGRATVRRTLDTAAHRPDTPAPAAVVDTPASRRLPDPPDLRLPRAIYYLGLLLLALLTVRVSGQVTFSDLLFLLSMMLAAADLIILRRNVPIAIPLLLLGGMAIFTIGGLLSSLESYAAFKSVATVARLIFLTVFWFWLGTVVLNRREHVLTAIALWVTSAAICGAGAVAQLLAGDVIPNTHTIYGRSTGFTAQPNDLGGLCVIAFVPAVMLTVRQGLSPPRRLLAYIGLLVVMAGLVLSGSVGAMIAAPVAVFVWFALQPTARRSLMPFVVIVAALLALTTFQSIRGDPTPLARFQHVTEKSPGDAGAGSLESRISTYKVAAAAIERDPFLGVGLDLVSVTKPFGVVSYEYDVHNLVIGTWYKAGLFGLIGMLLALFAVLRAGWTAILDSRTASEEMMGAALLSSFVAFVVFAMSAPVLFSRYGWIPAALLLALRAVQLREPGLPRRAEPRPTTRRLRAVPVAATDFGR